MPRVGDGLMKRKGVDPWQWQYIVPERYREMDPTAPAKIVKSTGTTDRLKARIVSAPWREQADRVADFLESMIAGRYSMAPGAAGPMHIGQLYKMEPGTDVLHPDGSLTIADERSIVTWSADRRRRVSEEPNIPMGLFQTIKIATRHSGTISYSKEVVDIGFDGRPRAVIEPSLLSDAYRKPLCDDEAILEHWASECKIGIRFLADAKKALAVFHATCPGKTFASADYDDGRALVAALAASGNKSATVRKKVAFLRSSINVAKKSPRKFPSICHRDNPFSGVFGKQDRDALEKLRLDEDDIRLIMSRMAELPRDDRTLLTWCIATGCRRSEPFQVVSEESADGRRIIAFGTKTVASYRRIALPPILQQLHPEPITGPLFVDNERTIGQRINRWFRKIGITDERKTLHSTRHRAAFILQNADSVKDSTRWRLLGHEQVVAVPETYGRGVTDAMISAMALLWPSSPLPNKS